MFGVIGLAMVCALSPWVSRDVVLDRVEGDVAVVEDASMERWDVPAAWLPREAGEGARLEIRVRLRCEDPEG